MLTPTFDALLFSVRLYLSSLHRLDSSRRCRYQTGDLGIARGKGTEGIVNGGVAGAKYFKVYNCAAGIASKAMEKMF